MNRRAVISVADKTGVVKFARELDKLGFEIVSTGGTAKVLRTAGLKVTGVSEVTGFPECLDGRVKTLHPKIHAGILAKRSNPGHMKQIEELGVTPIDLVAINLYPFRRTIMKPGVKLEEAIENIDIGGPAMIRSAAKNWQDVAVIVDQSDYIKVIEEIRETGEVSRKTKFMLCGKAFEHTAQYDALIADYLRRQRGETGFPQTLTLTFDKVQELSYGENPHQPAAFYSEAVGFDNALPAAEQLHGKKLSYNSINDLNGALDLMKEFGFDSPAAVVFKHANPCGVGFGQDIHEAYMNACNADPMSISGGIAAFNREVDEKTAEELSKTSLESIIAPSYSETAFVILSRNENIRLMRLPNLARPNSTDIMDIKTVAGGMLVQKPDAQLFSSSDLCCVTKRKPNDQEIKDMLFAWKVVKHVKSNGIAIVKGNGTVGIGPGQANRITALELAIKSAGDRASGSVMASDAYFPFSDCVEAAEKSGITAIIQPGGSMSDEESIKAADKAGIAMVFTGMRHFKH